MQPRKLMGFETPGDQRVPISVRDWSGLKLALWRSKVAWDIAERAAGEIIERCEHADGCRGKDIETEPCLPYCTDRELRMSALVVLNAARMFAPIDARRPASEQYWAPSREYFSEVIAELATAQIEIDALREALRAAGGETPTPPENTEPKLPASRLAPQLVEYEPDQELDDDPATQVEENPT
jgi:hypothetical protein